MNYFFRWLLLVPALIGASTVCFALLTLLWNLVASLNIVPQTDIVSLGLANFGINVLSAAAGVAAGAALIPAYKGKAALVSASISVVVALVLLVWAANGGSPLSMSLGWHIWSTLGWIFGAIGSALGIRSNSSRAGAHTR